MTKSIDNDTEVSFGGVLWLIGGLRSFKTIGLDHHKQITTMERLGAMLPGGAVGHVRTEELNVNIVSPC